MTGAGNKAFATARYELKLLLFRGQCFAVQKKIFGAKQADSLRATGLHAFHVLRLLDVCGERQAHSVKRHGRLVERVAEFFIEADVPPDELAVLEKRLVRGIDDNLSVITIQQRVLPVPEFSARIAQCHHRRNAQ